MGNINSPHLDTIKSPNTLMQPRRLGALPSTPFSATRTFLDRMIQERWFITLAHSELDSDGNGQLVYRVQAPGNVFTVLVFSTSPVLVNRTPRIIGSSWDIIGAVLEGEADEARIEQTKAEMPKLYAGRAAAGTLIWFRANRSLRLFEEIVEQLAAGQQPDVHSVRQTGYLIRNTGLDGNGTFGTKDFSAYGPDHALAVPYHAQMLAAYVMREASFDLCEGMARARSSNAVPLNPDLKQVIAVGNGSALGLALFFMNRPRLISRWIGLYQEALARVLDTVRGPEDPALDDLEELLQRSIRAKELDPTDYQVFPSATLVALELKQILRSLRYCRNLARKESHGLRLAEVATFLGSDMTPEAVEIFNSLSVSVDGPVPLPTILSISIDESMDTLPGQSVSELIGIIRTDYQWIVDFPLAPEEMRNRRWYKSRASEEPRSGHSSEVPGETYDLATNIVWEARQLLMSLDAQDPKMTIGDFVLLRPEFHQVVTWIQNLRNAPYALARVDFHDDTLIPAYFVHLLNVFCFGLDKTQDLNRRALRGVLFENAPTRDSLTTGTADRRWWLGADSFLATSLNS